MAPLFFLTPLILLYSVSAQNNLFLGLSDVCALYSLLCFTTEAVIS